MCCAAYALGSLPLRLWDVCGVKKRGAVTELAWWQGKGRVWVSHSHPCHPQLPLRWGFMNRDCCCSVAKLDPTLWPRELQHARLPCPSLSPRVRSNSCPLSQWCHLTILSSAAPSSFFLLSFLGSGSFPMSLFFTLGSKSVGASFVASVLPMNMQGWFPLKHYNYQLTTSISYSFEYCVYFKVETGIHIIFRKILE